MAKDDWNDKRRLRRLVHARLSMIRIRFFVDGEDCGADEWPAVPRLGEEISFPPDYQLLGSFVVDDVVWQMKSGKGGDIEAIVHLTPSD
jgi:hypothetical protein